MAPTRRQVGKALFAAGLTAPALVSTSQGAGNPAPRLYANELSRSAIRSPQEWNAVYERNWGPLGVQSDEQVRKVLHAEEGYDDRHGVFAWVVHPWIRAFVALAESTGNPVYLETAWSFIATMLKHTDARRIARGEIVENYLQDPLYLKGTGLGGPFWKQDRTANALHSGQVVRAILTFADAVLSNAGQWSDFKDRAARGLEEAARAVDAFDNDWQERGEGGAYHYRDSSGTGMLGTTRMAFNQSATMVAAQLILYKHRPGASRAEKVRRLARHWLDEYARFQPDGTVVWRYILIPSETAMEDAGHATIDLDFLEPAYRSGLTDLTRAHMDALATTFLKNVLDNKGGLNKFVDGKTVEKYADHFNAGFGWARLARYKPEILTRVHAVYNTHYRPDGSRGTIWAQPMLGWANLLCAGTRCGA
ncbi:MAG: hypothetical protein AAGF59_09615 [Pseudomonadota bacterium]